MLIVGKKLTEAEFLVYVQQKDFGTIRPQEIVLHHTWKPTLETWAGEKTIQALKTYYEGLGWNAGPHIFVAPDGIWLFTDMSRVGIHAGAGNAIWQRNGQTLRGYYQPNATLVTYSIGVEVVGNYDEKIWPDDLKSRVLFVLSTLKTQLGITTNEITFHRDYSPKTCPGNMITRAWFEQQLTQYEHQKHGGILATSYQYQFSAAEAQKAIELGLLKQIDTETREILAIGLVRLYEKIKSDFSV